LSEALQPLLGGTDFLPEPIFADAPDLVLLVSEGRPLHNARIAGERRALCRAVCIDLLAGRSHRAIAADYRVGRQTITAIEQVMRSRDELLPLAQTLQVGLGQCIVLMLFRLREALIAGEFSAAQIPIALGVLIDKKAALDAGLVPGTERTVEDVTVDRARSFLELVKLRAAEGVSGGNSAHGPIIEVEPARDTGPCPADVTPGGVPAATAGTAGDGAAATGREGGGGGPAAAAAGRTRWEGA
jgi:hypothetical protein